MNAFTSHLSNFKGRRSLAKCRLSRVHGQMLTVACRLSKVCDQMLGVPCNHRKSSEILDNLWMFGTVIAFLGRHLTNVLATVDINNCHQRTYGNMAQFVLDFHKSSHWGRGPMETGVYMLGTFQALAESSPNVPARYISFTFQM